MMTQLALTVCIRYIWNVRTYGTSAHTLLFRFEESEGAQATPSVPTPMFW